jgi:hypothetical protein
MNRRVQPNQVYIKAPRPKPGVAFANVAPWKPQGSVAVLRLMPLQLVVKGRERMRLCVKGAGVSCETFPGMCSCCVANSRSRTGRWTEGGGLDSVHGLHSVVVHVLGTQEAGETRARKAPCDQHAQRCYVGNHMLDAVM